MQIQFHNRGHAEFCLKTCMRVFTEQERSKSGKRLPKQRIRNTFCRNFGYSSYDHFRDLTRQPHANAYPELDEDLLKAAVEKGYNAALEVVGIPGPTSPFGVIIQLSNEVAGSYTERHHDPDPLVDRIWHYISNGKPDKLRSDVLNLGGIFYCIGIDYPSVEDQLKVIMGGTREHPASTEARVAEALLLLGTGSYEAARSLAEEALAEAIRLLGTDAPDAFRWGSVVKTRLYMCARHALGQALWSLGEYESAIREMESLLTLDPDDHLNIREFIGDWYLTAKNFDAAIILYNRRNWDTFSYYNKALAYVGLNDTANAVLNLRAAFMLDVNVARRLLKLRALKQSSAIEKSDAKEYANSHLGETWSLSALASSLLKACFGNATIASETSLMKKYSENWLTTKGDQEAAAKKLNDFTNIARLQSNNDVILAEVTSKLR